MHKVIIFLNSLNFLYTCSLACLFVWSLSSPSRTFHSFGDVTISGEGLQIFNYARHLWQLSSDGSFTCHTYYDTRHPFIMVISEDPRLAHMMPSVWQWSVAAWILTPNLLHSRRTLLSTAPPPRLGDFFFGGASI